VSDFGSVRFRLNDRRAHCMLYHVVAGSGSAFIWRSLGVIALACGFGVPASRRWPREVATGRSGGGSGGGGAVATTMRVFGRGILPSPRHSVWDAFQKMRDLRGRPQHLASGASPPLPARDLTSRRDCAGQRNSDQHPPEPGAQVRILLGAPSSQPRKPSELAFRFRPIAGPDSRRQRTPSSDRFHAPYAPTRARW
jgi:hypothetical protein